MVRGGAQLGISVSDQSIEIIEIVRGKTGFTTPAVSRVSFEKGIIEKGIVVDTERFATVVQEALKAAKPRPFSTRRAVFTMPDVRSFLHVFRFPPTVTERELRTALRYQAEEIIPIKPSEAAAGFSIVEHNKDHTDVLYVAAEKKVLEGYVKPFQAAEIELVAVGSDSVGLARLVPPVVDEKKAVLMVDLGGRTSTLLVIDCIGIRSSFTRFTAGDAMTDAIADQLNVDAKEASSLKVKHGVKGDIKIKEILLPFLEQISKDILSTIAWHEEHHKSEVKDIIFVGGGSLLRGLLTTISPMIGKGRPGISLRLLDLWKLVVPGDKVPVKKASSILFGPAVAAGLWGMRQKHQSINLLKPQVEVVQQPKSKKKKSMVSSGDGGEKKSLFSAFKFNKGSVQIGQMDKKEKIKLIAAVAFIVIAVGVLVGALFYRGSKLKAVEEQVAAIISDTTKSKTFVREISLPFSLGVDAETSDVVAQIVELENVERFESVEAGTIETMDGIATGEVTLLNTSSRDQPLIATTRLLTQDGVLFRLESGVTVPANGSVVVSVYADESGISGDVDSSTFTIPGLTAARQEEVFAQSDTQMTGGIEVITNISDEDLDAAANLAFDKLQKDLVAILNQESGEDFTTTLQLSQIIEVSREIVTSISPNDEERTQVLVRFNIKALMFDEDDFKLFVERDLAKTGESVGVELISVKAYEVTDVNESFEEANIIAKLSIGE